MTARQPHTTPYSGVILQVVATVIYVLGGVILFIGGLLTVDPGRGPGPSRGPEPDRDRGPCQGADDGWDPQDCTHSKTKRYGRTDAVGDAYWEERCCDCDRTVFDKHEAERERKMRGR